jgi:hypothetical protein
VAKRNVLGLFSRRNLYKNGPADARGLSPRDLNDAVKHANAVVANAGAAANSIVKAIEDLIKECEKLFGEMCGRAPNSATQQNAAGGGARP